MEITTLENEINPRPQFLKVLCILSFIMCGITLLTGLAGLKDLFMTVDELVSLDPLMQQLQEINPAAYQATIESMQYKNISAIANLIIPLLSLLSVVFMWQLKKKGLYIYILAELLPYLVIFFTTGVTRLFAMGEMMGGEVGSTIMYVVLILVVVFDILFITLYALNFKHMK